MSNTNSFNTTNSYNRVWNNCTIADGLSQILTWLSPLEPRLRHQDIQDSRVESVGEWLLQAEEFRSWCTVSGGGGSDSAILFCYGDPGVGKTYISSLVVDHLCDQAIGENTAVACFYFDFAARKEQSSTSMLGALLKQVVGGLQEVPEEIVRAYEDQKMVIGGRAPRLADIVKMLQTTSSGKCTFMCIDALDECAADHRVKLLDSLDQIIQKSPGTRIFVTGRPHIRDEIQRRISGRVTSMRITPKRSDIIGYLRTRLNEDTNPDVMDRSLEADILKKIPEDISEMFLLVSLSIDAILQETTIYRRRQKLSVMTDGLGLGDAYGATLNRIKGQGGEKARLGMAALMWISHAERPLKSDELCHALAIEIGSVNLNIDNIPSIGTLLSCCQGLVVVDRKASIVRLIHFTLADYLRVHTQLFGTAHSTIAETCLSYLNSQQVRALLTSPSPDLPDTPFLEYSSVYWGVHAKRNLSIYALLLALRLFDGHKIHIPIKILLEARGHFTYGIDYDKLCLFSGLHWASVFGIDAIVATLVGVGCDTNQMDCLGNTPLVWAAWNGHEGVVRILLGPGGVNPETPNRSGQTPLCFAARKGHEGVVKILLGRGDVNPDRAERYGQTPLCYAAANGHEGVVKILLGRGDVNPDKPDGASEMPLCCAAASGHEGVVKILLSRGDVDPDRPNRPGDAPLLCAVDSGHEGVVRILLGLANVDPEKSGNFGRVPLHVAAWRGHEGVMKMLLGRGDVNPDKSNQHGDTPLKCAAWKGHEGVVKILLARGDVNPNKPDKDGQTPLWCAVWNGHEGVVEILLGRDDVNPNIPDNQGRTPLQCAVERGYAGVIALLQPPESTTFSTT